MFTRVFVCTCSCCSGLWNVPYITQAYLIKGSVLRSKLSQVSLYVDREMDPDMVFCRSIRDQVTHAKRRLTSRFSAVYRVCSIILQADSGLLHYN